MSQEILQGQIWIADLPPPLNRRPVLVLTRSSAIKHLHNVTVATISTRIRGLDTEVELTPAADAVPRKCVVSLDNVLTLPKEYLDSLICSVSSQRMTEVFEAIHVAFEMPY